MRSTLLSSSAFGKFYESSQNASTRTIQLQKIQDLTHCKLTLETDRIYLLDSKGKLSCLNINNKSLSTLQNYKIQHFHPNSRNSLSLTAVNLNSEIVNIQFQNKKVEKICNPCLNRLLSFQKNYLTEHILLVESKLIVLFDSSFKIKSLKARGNDLYVGACLLGINSYICALLKSGEIHIYQILALKSKYSTKLPFLTNGMKIKASNGGKTIAIYGDSCWLFLLKFDQKSGLTCNLAELPFHSILDLQFSYQGELLLLGSDRILYGVNFDRFITLQPLFNKDQAYTPTGFDIAIDQKSVILIGGKNVHILAVAQGLKKAIKNASDGIRIELVQQASSEHVLKVNRDNQQRSQDNSKNIEKQNSSSFSKQNVLSEYVPSQKVPIFNESMIKVDMSEQYNALLNAFKFSSSDKNTLLKIYFYLLQSDLEQFIRKYRNQVFKFISKIFLLVPNVGICANICFQVLSNLKTISSDQSLEKLTFILAPKVVSTVKKMTGLSLDEFIIQLTLNLFQDYLPKNNSKEIINLIIKNINKEGYLATLLVNLVLNLIENGNSNENKKEINIKLLQTEVYNILQSPKYAYLYAKPQFTNKQVAEVVQSQNLQELLQRQQNIKQALKAVRSNID